MSMSADSNQSRSQGSQTSSHISPIGDPQSPYYLHHINHQGSVIINPKLTTSNYVAWSRSFFFWLCPLKTSWVSLMEAFQNLKSQIHYTLLGLDVTIL
ncbi:Uncharacterized protein TCM_011646 [Theobroma cacao]|uniref:Retrotransposon Copia-like N-terminal domain-containing protein n=1 Tax=Theobroma cacao TaxID=3641 RepID=A0A061EB34_THECC|nr:Uncharacterized protein TCM_011646 [Theobroma cacao]